jgi:hypothetical protein
MIKPKNMRPSPNPVNLAKELLTKWNISAKEDFIKIFSKDLIQLSLNYYNYLEKIEENQSDSIKLPNRKIVLSILLKIATAASDLDDAIHIAKTIHPRFINEYLHFPVGSMDGGLLTDLEMAKNIDITPFSQSLDMLAIKAWRQFIDIIEAASSPNMLSYYYGHPTMRMLVDCIFVLERRQIKDPLVKLDDIADKVQYLTDPKADAIPGWDDYGPQVKKWWRAEGREIWSPALALPSYDEGSGAEAARIEWVSRIRGMLDRIGEMALNGDLGQFGGVYPDARKLRKKAKRSTSPKT